jgi:hypothetical protein
MATQHEYDNSTEENELIEDSEDFATDWLDPWALTDFADLIDQQFQEMSGVEVYQSKLAELAG